MTAALEGGEWSAARPGRTLPPGKTRYPFYRRLGGSQGRSGRAESLVPTGIRSRTVQPVVSRYADWATRPTHTHTHTHTHIHTHTHTQTYIYIYFEQKLSTKTKPAFYVNYILSVTVTALVVTKQNWPKCQKCNIIIIFWLSALTNSFNEMVRTKKIN